MSITYDTYGKIKVRLVKVTRHTKENHDMKQLNVGVLLEGDFEKSFTSSDNSQVVPTDTCKNMVYVVARDHPIKSIEEYGQALAAKFLSEYSHVKKANIEITEDIWERMPVNGKPHGHSFVKAMYVRTAKISAPRGAPAVVESGVRDLQVLKTTGSGFENFHRCRYTTLPDVADRLFGTKIQAVWTYTPEAVRGGYKSVDFNDTWNKVLAMVFSTFATEYSPSVQRTIHSAGEKVVTRLAHVENITLSMPNIHNWTIDFTKLKLENTPDLLIPVDEPSGYIHATITKPKSKL